MKYLPAFIALSLVLTACYRRDEQHPKQLIGTWTNEDLFVIRLLADGSYSTELRSVKCGYEGTWYVKDGVLNGAITNVIPGNMTNLKTLEPIGTIDRLKILSADSSHLALLDEPSSNYFVTNIFTKER